MTMCYFRGEFTAAPLKDDDRIVDDDAGDCHFRGEFTAAPLKGRTSRFPVARERHFRGEFTAAPLKGSRPGLGRRRDCHFRGEFTAAPLKVEYARDMDRNDLVISAVNSPRPH